jgi:hypothetical protein
MQHPMSRLGARRTATVLAIVLAAVVALATCSAVVPTPSPASPPVATQGSPATAPTAVPVPSPTEPAVIVHPDFEPPAPLCPGPATAVSAPSLAVAVGEGAPRAADMGSSTVTTCSTASADDRPEPQPADSLVVAEGDELVFTIEAGWRILAWSAFDTPLVGEGGNVVPDTPTPDLPTSIRVPIMRPGESRVGVEIWAIGAEGRAIAHVGAVVRVSATP